MTPFYVACEQTAFEAMQKCPTKLATGMQAMGKKLLFAKPISEAVMREQSKEQLVWRDYLWNSGQVIRLWFVDPTVIDDTKISVELLQDKETSSGQ
ncbi:hypothetical protein ACXYMP_15955 [Aliiroseovarius sp. CAU 1755]